MAATLTVTQPPIPPTPSSSAASPPRRKRTNSRLQAWHDGADKQQQTQGRGPSKSRRPPGRQGGVKKDPPPLLHKVGLAAQIYTIRGAMGTVDWFQGWREWLYPPQDGPDFVKAYECRPGMGVRIFFPRTFDQTSPQTLPTILTVHGGGFCIGTSRDDDGWNRRAADSQGVLVVALPYAKAPRAPFPAGLADLEALYLAVLADESLPIDRTSSSSRGGKGKGRGRARGRIALAGFDAGANLALALSQMPAVRGDNNNNDDNNNNNSSGPAPTAVVSICGILDLSRPAGAKARNRPYKPGLPAPRGGAADVLAPTYPAYAWGYVPYGQDLRDPLLSPAFAAQQQQHGGGGGGGGLPPHVCLVAAELDMLAHESWRMACRLVAEGGVARGDGRRARWRVPDPDADPDADGAQAVCGRAQASAVRGALEMEELGGGGGGGVDAEDGLGPRRRFGFEVVWGGGDGEDDQGGSVRWVLVPDVVHGFDRAPWRYGGEETVRDAELKTVAYVDAVGGWLRETVWGVHSSSLCLSASSQTTDKMASPKPKANDPGLTLASTAALLAPGVRMPRLGFGTYRVPPAETAAVVRAALAAGYRHFDSAQLYNNEAELGRAVRECVQSSGVSRADVFLTTKIRYPGVSGAKTWGKFVDSVAKMSGVEPAGGRKGKRKRAVDDDEGRETVPVAEGGRAGAAGEAAAARKDGEEESRYVDLFLVHTPYGGANAQRERREMWLALERAYEEGRARAIGVSNYKVEHLEEMRAYAKVWPPHVNQIQLNPWCQQREVVAYCEEHGIVVQAFSPLGRGDRLGDAVLGAVAGRCDRSPAQVLIRYALQKGWVPLPKSERPERMEENADVFGFVIGEEDMAVLDGLDGVKMGYFD
ncbi:hypothetical protein KVR01_005928 [Diaporthe batatas]|uniref:uncharacterized protein n=1 Tax=Diaporthe batatas TaxID=748121 RepID=UPI001D03CCEB|nr:uncharacterized protein KVR01_005928 [Diaporthe batatas]KAG8164010.1 hypothetical protein KVR01_005928 [Diaporthe batatas]